MHILLEMEDVILVLVILVVMLLIVLPFLKEMRMLLKKLLEQQDLFQ